jgi:hypothetical protein
VQNRLLQCNWRERRFLYATTGGTIRSGLLDTEPGTMGWQNGEFRQKLNLNHTVFWNLHHTN